MRRFLFLLLCLSALVSVAGAEVTRLCAVSWKSSTGWSREIYVPVTFSNGSELNRGVKGLGFSARENYASLQEDSGQFQILQLRTPVLFVTDTFRPEHFEQLFEVNHATFAEELEMGRQLWRIRAKTPSPLNKTWIDPVLKEAQR